ncbi:MAG: response regulator [Nitrospiraceae bacterium]|nr:response regulator [Nitrospiraceae bacterium]
MDKAFLVVDDSAAIRQLVTLAVKGSGYDVVTASGPKEALSLLSSRKFDLVITDLNMPETDGIEFIRMLRGMTDYKFTPIIMLTTEVQDAKKREGRAAGASGWIVKPFSAEQILDVVRRFLA